MMLLKNLTPSCRSCYNTSMTYYYSDPTGSELSFVVVAEDEIQAAGKLATYLKSTKLMKVKDLRHFQIREVEVLALEGVIRV